MKKGTQFSSFPFHHPYVLTILEYHKLTSLPDLRIAGQFEVVTNASAYLYASLNNNGFGLVLNCFKFKPQDGMG